MTSERMASSLARPPALRMMWASPSASPRDLAGSGRASLQRESVLRALTFRRRHAAVNDDFECAVAFLDDEAHGFGHVQVKGLIPNATDRRDDCRVCFVFRLHQCRHLLQRSF